MAFHAPAVGEASLPEASSFPGCPLLSAYTPATRAFAFVFFAASTVSVVDGAVCRRVGANASALPAWFTSTSDPIAFVPRKAPTQRRTTRGGCRETMSRRTRFARRSRAPSRASRSTSTRARGGRRGGSRQRCRPGRGRSVRTLPALGVRVRRRRGCSPAGRCTPAAPLPRRGPPVLRTRKATSRPPSSADSICSFE